MTEQDRRTLSFYAKPGLLTSAGRFAALLGQLPHDIGGLAAVAQGLLIHEHLAAAYGVTLSAQDRASVHLRPAEQLLAAIVSRDGRPLATARAAADRLPANCRHFTVLMVTMLRAQGTPARARCGFGGYFGGGTFEDHWVCEYWDAGLQRWILVDAQIDGRQRDLFPIDFDVTDVPRDRFLDAGQAWSRCRSGAADPAKFGFSLLGRAGYWWIAGNLMRDAAALDNLELLPWDAWGAMPAPDEAIDDDLHGLFDRLAELTQAPDAAFAELWRLCRDDDRLRVPPTVYNALRDRYEAI
jgi:Transglutaminase-like superfamily